MTTPTDKLDGLLHQVRTAAQKLADELEYALELLREEESIEIDVQQLTLDWNRARTELAMAVYGTSTYPDGGLDACAKVIADRRRYGDLEAEVARAQSELRYLEQSPAGLVQELTALIASKREQVELLAAELAEITPPSAPAPPAPAPPPLPEPAPVAMPPKPDRCDVCAERQDHLESSGDHWSCAECLCLEKEVDSARKRLESWGARPLDQSVPSTSELPGVAAVRAEGREAMYALASRRSAAQAAKRAPTQVRRPAKPAASGGTTPPSVDDLRLRWNAHS
ncbi:hypothetical protein [Prescottella subtropica]|uniref:hypothetical protein n=1 Tax=Prescottella subtropica TaxID=2545757 RepID=UPI0010F67898|nr:hypothetical protein [Prescottella subtropica]